MDYHPIDYDEMNVTSTSESSNSSNPNILYFIIIMILNFLCYVIITIGLRNCSNTRNKIQAIKYENYFLKNPDPPEKDLLCSICLGSLNSNYVSTECNHYYHKDCIYEWLSQKRICPNCKNNLKQLETV